MADFYVLPPRPLVGEEIARLVRPYLPGVRVTAADGVRFLEQLIAATRGRAFLVHREDLPEGEDVATALRDGFGAEPVDRVVQVSAGARPGQSPTQLAAIGETRVVLG